MRTRSLVLGAFATLVAGTAFIIAAQDTSSPGDNPARESPASTARASTPQRPVHTAQPMLHRVLDGLVDQSVDPQVGHDALIEALQRDPAGTLATLEAFLADADPRQQATRTVVGALVQVGTPEIQEALVQLVEGRVQDTAFVTLVVPTLGKPELAFFQERP